MQWQPPPAGAEHRPYQMAGVCRNQCCACLVLVPRRTGQLASVPLETSEGGATARRDEGSSFRAEHQERGLSIPPRPLESEMVPSLSNTLLSLQHIPQGPQHLLQIEAKEENLEIGALVLDNFFFLF